MKRGGDKRLNKSQAGWQNLSLPSPTHWSSASATLCPNLQAAAKLSELLRNARTRFRFAVRLARQVHVLHKTVALTDAANSVCLSVRLSARQFSKRRWSVCVRESGPEQERESVSDQCESRALFPAVCVVSASTLVLVPLCVV